MSDQDANVRDDSMFEALGSSLAARGARLPLIPQARPSELPLSFAQQRMWFLHQFDPRGVAYNNTSAIRIRGAFDLQAFERALNGVIARHEILRTTFRMQGQAPVQDIHPSLTVTIERLHDELVERPFDLERGPLIRCCVRTLGEAEHALYLSLHHIVSDGWSMGVFWRELGALYRGEALDPLPIQYADHALWQHAQIALDDQLAYWKDRLAGAPAVLELPVDHPRPAAMSYRGALRTFGIDPALAARLRALSERAGATLYMTLLAVFDVLLARHTGQDDIVVGTPIANRQQQATEPLIGFFVNTLCMRTDLGGDPTFLELLDRVKHTALGAYAHQELPFEKLVEELHPERSTARSVVFQVMFILHNLPPVREQLAPGLALETLDRGRGSTKFDLTLEIAEDDLGGLSGGLEYATDLYAAETIDRMAQRFVRLCGAIADQPDERIGRLALLDAEERQQVVATWNATEAAFPHDRCVHALIADQAARTPDRVAVVFEDRQLRYRELDDRANQLAHHLRALGVRPGAVVGLLLERSLDMLVGLLGVLKAGAAYLPLDPSAPADRLGFMLRDAQVAVVVGHHRLAPRLPALDPPHGPLHLVQLDADWPVIARANTAPLAGGATPDDLIYVMYTSGSTGQPKGVMLAHRAVTNRVVDMQRAYLAVDDVVLHKTPYTFDVAVNEALCPLIVGATLVLARPDGHRDPAYLVRLIHDHQITFAELVPSLLHVLLAEPDVALRCRSLRTLIASGEALAPELADLCASRLPAALYNVYGPTEAGEVTAWRCRPDVSRPTPSVPLGRPMANVQIYLLDPHGQPVPIGARGELFIGGLAVARGYLRRPDLTAERFVPDPFGPPGSRLYRTGDLARYTADGLLEYLGRADHQVKIRGFRVELGEIEARLRQLPGVRDAAVLRREDRPGDPRLVAYVAPAHVTLDDLRAALDAALPDYMIPSAFVLLDALPLNPNGKLDRRALPPPDITGSAANGDAPLTETEQRLLAIWSDVLGIPHVAVTDDLFELGANSLLMVQGAARVRHVFGVELEQEELFELPTVRDMGTRIDAIMAKAAALVAAIPHTDEHVEAARAILADPSASLAARMGAQKFLEVVGRDDG